MAVGWTVTESIFTRLVNFYLNARSLQFDWQHLIDACEANLLLVSLIVIQFTLFLIIIFPFYFFPSFTTDTKHLSLCTFMALES